MGRRIVTTIQRTGPFFEHDPERTFLANAQLMMEGIAREGEADVQAQVMPHSRTRVFESGVVGRTHRLDGLAFRMPTAVVSQTHVYEWKNHRTAPAGAQYRGGKFERKFGFFGRTFRRVRSMRALNVAELLRGLQ
jgi:hypothetical protein